jgi:hypothetical protein
LSGEVLTKTEAVRRRDETENAQYASNGTLYLKHYFFMFNPNSAFQNPKSFCLTSACPP